MRRFIINTISFCAFLFVFLEIIIRITHFYNDVPVRQFDDFGVEKWQAFQEGYYYTGNKKEHISYYRINNFGYNSTLDFDFDNKDSLIIAIIGDSYIEGFNQNVQNSIGNKIMKEQPIKCYEMGYSGYDFASIVHLLDAYKYKFLNVEHIYISLNNSDFGRDRNTITERQKLRANSWISKIYRNIKLLMFIKKQDFLKFTKNKSSVKNSSNEIAKEQEVKNTLLLLKNIEYLKPKITFLFDSEKVDISIVQALSSFDSLDYAHQMKNSKGPNTFVFDKHWNDAGRQVIADIILSRMNALGTN